MFDVDPVALAARELLRDRTAELIAQTCAWAVGLSDQPHLQRRHGALLPSGLTLGLRAAADLALADDDGRIDLLDAGPGSFADALNALTPDGGLYADRFDVAVLEPFVLEVCVRAAQQVRDTPGQAWSIVLADTDTDSDTDMVELVRVGEWEAPLRIEAEHLVLAALAGAPLMQVEAEGLPLSLVQAAEGLTRRAAAPTAADGSPVPADPGSVFLAEVALRAAELTVPVPPAQADRLLDALLAEGLLPEDVPAVLAHLPVEEATAAEIRATIAVLPPL